MASIGAKILWSVTMIQFLAILLAAGQHQPVDPQIVVKVLVLNYDPLIASEGMKRLHEVGKWNDPKMLAQGYSDDVRSSSGGYVSFKIVEWRDVNEFPIKTDGYRYTANMYLAALKTGRWHKPDGLDYPKTIAENKVVPLVDSGKVDEIWLFGAPYMGFWESAMAGPGSFYINGGVHPEVKSKRPFAIMGFNYERGVAEMLHDLCHRTEATLSRAYGGWEVDKLTTNWAKFAANFQQSNGVAAVGTCHWPPNAERDYDYSNKREVESSADDWLNYPSLTGATKKLNCEAWGGPDYHRSYMKWWFQRLPKSTGVSGDGHQNNWWKYVFQFTKY
jgi:hypothetical protein